MFFSFYKSLPRKIKKIGATKRGLNKEIYEIINNVKLLCLIDIDKMEKYKIFLIENIDKLSKYMDFVRYLKNYWFKRPNEEHNHFKFIRSKYINNKMALDKLYFTNNITKSIHAKLNYFLPRHIANQYNFINSLKNMIINDTFKNSDIVRKDYKTKSLLLLIDKENLNDLSNGEIDEITENIEIEEGIISDKNNICKNNFDELINYIGNLTVQENKDNKIKENMNSNLNQKKL
jgi:hypothetical protein